MDSGAKRPAKGSFRLEYRRCGKASCWCASKPPGHGPYLYRVVREGVRVRRQYQGRIR